MVFWLSAHQPPIEGALRAGRSPWRDVSAFSAPKGTAWTKLEDWRASRSSPTALRVRSKVEMSEHENDVIGLLKFRGILRSAKKRKLRATGIGDSNGIQSNSGKPKRLVS